MNSLSTCSSRRANYSADSWSHIPLNVLHAELKRRQDEGEKPDCGTKGTRGDYNMGLHVFALLLILFLSTLGMGLPLVDLTGRF